MQFFENIFGSHEIYPFYLTRSFWMKRRIFWYLPLGDRPLVSPQIKQQLDKINWLYEKLEFLDTLIEIAHTSFQKLVVWKFDFGYSNIFCGSYATSKPLRPRYVLALELWFCGIVIVAQNSGFVPQITLTDFAESYIRKKGEVEQHSRISD